MNRKVSLLFVVLGMMSVLTLPSAFAQDNQATLEPFLGIVEILPADSNEWQAVTEPTPLAEGDAVRTNGEGWALITFFDGTTTELLGDTEILVAALELPTEEGGAFNIQLDQIVGDTYSIAETVLNQDSSFEVNAADRTLAVRGTIFYVLVTPEEQVTFSSYEGEVSTQAPEADAIPIVDGQSVIYAEDNIGAVLEAMIVPDSPQEGAPDGDRVGEGTLIIPNVPISSGGIELFPEANREQPRRAAIANNFAPYLAGITEEGTWLYLYYFNQDGLIDGWSRVEQLEITEAMLDIIPTVPESGTPQLPHLHPSERATIPQAR